MSQRFWISGLTVLALAVTARGEEKKPTAPPSNLDKMKKLVGTWVMAGKDGKPTDQVVSVVKVIGGGNVVHETLFPGTAMEMVSVYHMDGPDLIMVHYCAIGNQPHMKADPKSPANQIHFLFAGGTGFNPAKDMHMHEGTLTLLDDNHIQFCGVCFDGGKPVEGMSCDMKLVRKK